jgi:ABC-type glycerol-3-phosphate transport system permease component
MPPALMAAADFRMFWQIMLPLARPALATVLPGQQPVILE